MSTPKLRFPEFLNDEGWEQKKLKDLFEIGSGKDYKHLSTGDIPVYGSGGYMLSVDDFLYDGESVCIGRKGTIDKPMLLNGKFWTVDTLFYTHSFKDCSPRFIFSIFQNIDWLKHNEAGGVPSLSKTTINEIPTYIPKPKEQQKIADCLSSLDVLITAQNQKVEALKQHKKGLMQQLFPDSPPANGEYAEGRKGLVPKLRFPEFENTKKWEIVPLSSVSDVRDGTHDSPKFLVAGKPLLTSKNLLKDGSLDTVNVSFISDSDFEQINKRSKVDVGDILFGMIGTIGNPVMVKTDGFAIKNIALIKQKTDLLNSYLVQLLNSDYIAKEFSILNTGNSQKFIALGQIRSLKIPAPSLLEQQKIANFLSSIDELISTQTQQLEAYKTHKKGLMQQLFPSLDEMEA